MIIILIFRIISALLYVLLKITVSRNNSQCSNNSRDTWKTLNSLIRCRNTSKDVTLNHNGSSISGAIRQSVIAEVFNTYFSNIAFNLDRNIPQSNIFPLNFIGAPVEISFFCANSDSEEIVNLIRRWNKSTDLMNIPVFIYKILQVQYSLITRCLKVIFQNALKRLKLFSFSNQTANYRPISMLPLSKMLEKLICVLDWTIT